MAIDGKTVRRSHNRTIGKDAIHMVNAWTTRSGIALGQGKTDAKSNEITAIPPLLRHLNVAGCIVTVDAMGAQTRFVQAIRDEKADYGLRVKDNQGHLYQDIQDWFAHADHVQFADLQHSYAENRQQRTRTHRNSAVLGHLPRSPVASTQSSSSAGVTISPLSPARSIASISATSSRPSSGVFRCGSPVRTECTNAANSAWMSLPDMG